MKEGARGSQLIIFNDGTLYHIDLKKSDNIPKNLLFVGASERVDKISKHFDTVDFIHTNKARPEFHIAAGTYKGKPVAAFSCGIGPGSMEIVVNEFHALFEYDHENNKWSREKPEVNIIRVGTCGTSLKNIPVGTLAISKYSLGLDNMGAYYPPLDQDNTAREIENKFLETPIGKLNPLSYCSSATSAVVKALEEISKGDAVTGITTTSGGFFAPEGRSIGRLKSSLAFGDFLSSIQDFEHDGLRIVNHEMETSILFRLANEQLGYDVGAICVVLDNLASDEIIDPKHVDERTEKCIEIALDAIVRL